MTGALTLIYAKGCPACEEAKPEFQKLSQKLPWLKLGLLDVDRPGLNLDFPVNFTPTLHLAFEGRRFVTDPSIIGTFNVDVLQRWVMAAVQKARSQRK